MDKTAELQHFVEDPAVIERYNILKDLGKKIFGSSESLKTGSVTQQDLELAKQFLEEGAQKTHPEVWASYWEHVIIAPELGKKIAIDMRNVGLDIDPLECEFLLWLHEIGRMVVPAEYMRNDFIGDRLMYEIGIPEKFRKNLPSNANLLRSAGDLGLTVSQLHFQEPLTTDQEEKAQQYFDALTPVQRIINFADNLGKRDQNGIFHYQSLLTYLKTQEARYAQASDRPTVNWAIERRQASAVLQAITLEKTAGWSAKYGLNVDETLESLDHYGPKFILVVRHGELDNPNNIVYNRDGLMSPEDRIHLSEVGRKQMTDLAVLIQKRRFNPTLVVSSPETRAQESTQTLNRRLGIDDFKVDDELDDNFAPGPYQEKMTLNQLAEIDGNVYDSSRWGRYDHEDPDHIVARMKNVFSNLKGKLKIGQTGMLVSHGDPIAWLVNTFKAETSPKPADLRKLTYPNKGEAVVAVISPDNEVFTYYTLNNKSTSSKY